MEKFIDFINSYMQGYFGILLELLGILLGAALLYFVRGKSTTISTNPLPQKTGRNPAGDMMKGLAIHAVVIIHIDSYFRYFHPQGMELTLFLANIARFAVPWFIISSAMFLKWKEGYWQAKLANLVVPYVVISIAAYFVKYGFTQGWLADLVFRLATGSVFTPYYFVPLLLQFYLLYALVFRHFEPGAWHLFAAFVLNLLSNHLLVALLGKNPFSASLFTNYIFFFVLGLVLKQRLDKLQFDKKLPLFAVLFYLATLGHGTWHFSYEAPNHYLFYPAILFVLLPAVLKNRHSFWLELTGRYSLGIFLLHPFVIHFMHSFDPFVLGGAFAAWFATLALNMAVPVAVWSLYEYALGKFKAR